MRKREKMIKWEKIVSMSNANERLLFRVWKSLSVKDQTVHILGLLCGPDVF